jgi:probable F420-dependent oxidoreductase
VDLGRVGIWAFLDTPPAPQIRDIAAELEALGYGALWIPETLGRDPFVLAEMLLASTSTLTVATGIASIWARDAVAMNSVARTIGEAHPGRFVLGLGVSHARMVEDIRGREYRTPLATMRAYLDAMDGAFSTAPEPDPPVRRLLAALGPRMLELARDRTQGAHPYFATPEHTAMAREVLGAEPLLAPEQTVVLAPDPDDARRIARGFASGYLGLPNYANNLRRLGFGDDEIEQVDDRVVDATVAWGDVDAICARVQQHLDAGADHVCVQVLPHQPGHVPLDDWRALAGALTGL